MNTPMIEYGGGSSWGATAEQVQRKLRNAPGGVRARVTSRTAAAPPARPAVNPPAAQPDEIIGWIAGTCCPGVSVPVPSQADGRSVPEQFTDAAWRSMLRQTRTAGRPVPLTWDHYGPVIGTTRDLAVLFLISRSVGGLIGLEFEARLRDDDLGRRILAAGADGLGVSIAYTSKRQWHVERDGIGTVRVVDDAVLDHVAVLPGSATQRPAFPAARCYAGKGRRIACPAGLHDRAQLDAYAVLKRQAGVRS